MILNVEEVETPDNTEPLLIPETCCVADNVSVLPSLDILVILLKTELLPGPLLYDIIDPVFIPTFPAKLRLLTVAELFVIFNWSVSEKPGKTRS